MTEGPPTDRAADRSPPRYRSCRQPPHGADVRGTGRRGPGGGAAHRVQHRRRSLRRERRGPGPRAGPGRHVLPIRAGCELARSSRHGKRRRQPAPPPARQSRRTRERCSARPRTSPWAAGWSSPTRRSWSPSRPSGVFKGFSAVCTHVGCLCNQVADGTIDCPCHGSKFTITTGAVVAGPAPSPLPAAPITVTGGKILLQ